jgi:hypothetical protein
VDRVAPTLAERCGLAPDGPPASVSEVIDRALRMYLDLIGGAASAALDVESQQIA